MVGYFFFLYNSSTHIHTEEMVRSHILLTVSLFLSLRRTKRSCPGNNYVAWKLQLTMSETAETLTSSREAAEAALLPDSGELIPEYIRLLFRTDQSSVFTETPALSFID